jgi:hypothetical protein
MNGVVDKALECRQSAIKKTLDFIRNRMLLNAGENIGGSVVT